MSLLLRDGTPIRAEHGEFSIVTGNPQRIGDEALLRTAWHEVVRVMLLPAEDGGLWLVRIHKETAPTVIGSLNCRPRLGPDELARLIQKALRLKRKLKNVEDRLRGVKS